jgi:hypothetical protein
MRKWVAAEIEQLRELGHLIEDGLLVVDVLREGDREPSFRTLVQFDGDVLLSIAAAALTDPDFADAHTRHLEHVERQLRAHTEGLGRRIRRLSVLMSGSGGAAFGFGTYGSGLTLQLVDGTWAVYASGAGSLVVGVVAWPLGRKVLQGVIKWRLGHDRRERS